MATNGHDEVMGDQAQGGAPPDPIRVLLVDDHAMFASSLAYVLDAEPDMRVIDTAATAQAALEKCAAHAPGRRAARSSTAGR